MLERQSFSNDADASAAVDMAQRAGMHALARRIASRRGQAWLDRRRLDCALRWFASSEDSQGLWKVGSILLALLVGPNQQPTLPPAAAKQAREAAPEDRAVLSRDLASEREQVDALSLAYACLVLRPLLPGGMGDSGEGAAEEQWASDPRLDGPRQSSGGTGAVGAMPPPMTQDSVLKVLASSQVLLTCVQVACARLAVADAASCLRSSQRLPDASFGFARAAHRRWFSGTAVQQGLGPIAASAASAVGDAI